MNLEHTMEREARRVEASTGPVPDPFLLPLKAHALRAVEGARTESRWHVALLHARPSVCSLAWLGYVP